MPWSPAFTVPAPSLVSQLPPDLVLVADGVSLVVELAVPLPASSVLFDEAGHIAQGHRFPLIRCERPAVPAELLTPTVCPFSRNAEALANHERHRLR